MDINTDEYGDVELEELEPTFPDVLCVEYKDWMNDIKILQEFSIFESTKVNPTEVKLEPYYSTEIQPKRSHAPTFKPTLNNYFLRNLGKPLRHKFLTKDNRQQWLLCCGSGASLRNTDLGFSVVCSRVDCYYFNAHFWRMRDDLQSVLLSVNNQQHVPDASPVVFHPEFITMFPYTFLMYSQQRHFFIFSKPTVAEGELWLPRRRRYFQG